MIARPKWVTCPHCQQDVTVTLQAMQVTSDLELASPPWKAYAVHEVAGTDQLCPQAGREVTR